MRRASWLTAVIVVCSAAWTASAQDIGWQEAVARLKQERTLAETCVSLLKKYGDAGAIDRGRLAYADAVPRCWRGPPVAPACGER